MENLEKCTVTWETLGEVCYRRYTLSKLKDIDYKLDYSKCHIAASRNGGLIAFIRKSNVFIMDVINPIKDSIRIFYQDGTALRSIKFGEREKTIVLLEFTDDENLICIMHDGRIFKFDIITSTYKSITPGNIFSENNIIDARLFENGFVCLTKNGTFYIIKELKEPIAIQFFSLKGKLDNYLPNDYVFIPGSVSKSTKTELLFPHNKHGVMNILENGEIKYIKHSNVVNWLKSSGQDPYTNEDLGKVLNIVISRSNQSLAFFNDTGNIYVFPSSLDGNIDFQRHMTMTKLFFKPNSYQIMWCADDCVVIASNGQIFVVGPDDKLLKLDIVKSYVPVVNNDFSFSGQNMPNMYCLAEIDGVRIFTDQGVELLQKVNDDLFRGTYTLSLDPSKKLLEAFNYAEEKKPNCDEEIRKIRQDLPDAVNQLLNAATTQWDISNQLYLVKAAQHGKTFLTKEEFNFNNFVHICKDLRILNNLRTSELPRLITYDQYKNLDSKKLIKRLMKTQNFFIAYEISLYLNLKVRKVYQKWAVAQIKNLPSDLTSTEEIGFYNEIQKKLNEITGISYIKLAKKAFKYRKEEIGIKFLENEKSILTKIPQYVELKKWDKALELAFDTYDSNVMYTVLNKIMSNESVDAFKIIVSKYKKIDPFVIDYLKNNHPNLVKDYLELRKNYEGLILYCIENFFLSIDLDSRRKYIKDSKNYLKMMENIKDRETSPNFDIRFYKVIVDDIEKSVFFKQDLLKDDIIKQTDITTFDCSVFDVYKTIIKAEKYPLAENKNKQLFEVQPKKLSILRLRTYAELNSIDAIIMLSNNIKGTGLSPLHFAEIYLDNRMPDRVVEQLKRVTEEDYFDYKITLLKFIE